MDSGNTTGSRTTPNPRVWTDDDTVRLRYGIENHVTAQERETEMKVINSDSDWAKKCE